MLLTVKIRSLVIHLVIVFMLTSCGAKNGGNDPSKVTPASTPVTNWGATESAISNAVLGTPAGKCEWEMLGWWEQERYIWAFCQSGPGVEANGVSSPAKVMVNNKGSVESVVLPDAGLDFAIDVKRMFPPAVQEKILAQDFDLFAFMNRLEDRWRNAALPPDIYSHTRNTLPATGEAALPGVTAANADRIVEKTMLGKGNVKRVQFLLNGQILLSGDRGIGYGQASNNQFDFQGYSILENNNMQLSPDGQLLAVNDDRYVHLFHPGDQNEIRRIDTNGVAGKIVRVQFLGDGHTLVVEKTVPSEGFSPSWLALYSLTSGTLLNSWRPGGSNFVLSSNGYYLAGLYDTAGMAVWSIASGMTWQTLPVVASAASFSADGQILAVVESSSKVKLFWVWDGFEIGRLEKDIGHIIGVALSPDGKTILTWSDDSTASLWSVPDFERIDTYYVDGLTTASFNPDGTEIILVGSWSISLVNLPEKGQSSTELAIYDQVLDLSFAPDRTFSQGQRLAVAYIPGSIYSLIVNWDLATQTELFIRSEYQATSLMYTRDPYGIALGTRNNTVELIDADAGHSLRTFTGPGSQVFDLSIDAAGHLAAGSLNEVRVYSLVDPDELKGREIPISGGWVTDVIWPCFLAGAVDNGNIQVLDESGQEKIASIKMPKTNYDIRLGVLPGCTRLIAAQDKSIYQIDTETWEPLPSWEMTSYITALAVSPDGTLTAVGLTDNTLRLIDSETGAELRSLQGHSGMVTALEFSPDGSVLASGGSDGVVIIWGVE